MVTSVRTETREQAIARLAQRARESGVAIRRDSRDGRYYVSSASTWGAWHYCTAVSCDCRGFASRGRCMHHSLLLVHLGWVDDGGPTPEPTTWNVPSEPVTAEIRSEPTTCQHCHGQGSEPSTELFGGRRLDVRVTCWHCRGTGEQRAA